MKTPSTFAGLCVLLLRSTVRGLFRRALFLIALGFLVWLLHTWLLVYVNEGFNLGSRIFFGPVLAAPGQTGAASLVWMAGAILVFRLLGVVRHPLLAARALRATPGWAAEVALTRAPTAILGLGLGAAGGLAFSWWWRNPVLTGLFGLLLLGAVVRRGGNLLPVASRLAADDARRLLGRPRLRGVSEITVLAMIGASALLLRLAWVPLSPTVASAYGLGLVVSASVLAASVWAFGARGLAVVALFALTALGDDGGWAEAGGTMSGWSQSPGALEAVLRGLGPALGAMGGVFWGLLGADLWPAVESIAALPPDARRQATQDLREALEETIEPPETLPAQASQPEPEPSVPPEEAAPAPPADLPVPDDRTEPQWLWLDNLPDADPDGWFDRWGGPGLCGRQGAPIWWVHMGTLQLGVRDTIFQFQTRGVSVRAQILWTPGRGRGCLGLGWTASWEGFLERDAHGTTVQLNGGRRLWFDRTGLHRGFALQEDTVLDRRTGDRWIFDQGVLTGRSDRFGQALSFEREAGRVVSVRGPAGRHLRFAYDAHGRCVRIEGPTGTATLSYTSDRLSTVVDAAGVQSRYRYDEDGLVGIGVCDEEPVQIAYQEGLVARFVEHGRTTHYRRLPDGRTERVGPDAVVWFAVHEQGQLVERTGPAGTTRMHYQDGHCVQIERPDGLNFFIDRDELGRALRIEGGPTPHQFSWEGLDLMQARIGERVCRTWYENGRPIETHLPDGTVRKLRWSAAGDCEEIELDGAITQLQHDELGRPIHLRDAAGRTVDLTWTPGDRIEQVTDGNGQSTRSSWDANGRLTGITHADGAQRTMTLACCHGHGLTDETGRTWTHRIADGRVVEREGPAGACERFEHDTAGRLTAIEGDVRISVTRQDAQVSTIRVGDTPYHTVHDTLGRLESLVGPDGELERVDFDRFGRTVRTNFPGGAVSRRFDSAGDVIEVTNARGQRTQLTRDANGRITQIQRPERTERVQWGPQITVEDAAGHTVHSHDASGLWTGTRGETGTLALTHDAAGRVKTVRAGPVEVVYTRDVRGRITRIQWGEAWVERVLDSAGRVLDLRRSCGVHSRFSVQPDGRIRGVEHLRGREVVASRSFERDVHGRVVAVEDDLPVQGLPSPPQEVTFADGRPVTVNGTPVEHDADGNLTALGSWTAAYDSQQRLVEVDSQRLEHDAFGRLVRHGDRRLGVGLHGRTWIEDDHVWIWADGTLIGGWAPSGPVFFLFSPLGHTLGVTDATGALLQAYAYDPWGRITARSTDHEQPWTWLGQHGVRTLADDLFHCRFRAYHAGLGRFLQRDPIGLRGGPDPYAYAGSAPTTETDASGLSGPKKVFNLWMDAVALHRRARSNFLADRLGRVNDALESVVQSNLDADRLGEVPTANREARDGALRQLVEEHEDIHALQRDNLTDMAEIGAQAGDVMVRRTAYGQAYQAARLIDGAFRGDLDRVANEIGAFVGPSQTDVIDDAIRHLGHELGEVLARPPITVCGTPPDA